MAVGARVMPGPVAGVPPIATAAHDDHDVMTVHRGHWTRDDRAASIYQYVEFDVAPGAVGVSVRLSFDRTRGVLDLGVFGPEGFRGYSGGARDRFAISADAATPGYLPGRLPAGEWRVLLGLHRIPAEGLAWRVDVEVGPAAVEPPQPRPALPDRPPARQLPAADGRRWLAGDFHTHTVHSDGALTIESLAALARARGLDVLAVTDHNTTSHHPHLAAVARWSQVLLLPGQEVTTDVGHANCFGDVGWVDFRRPADEWLAAAERGGGLLSINHPLAGDCAWRKPLSRPTPLVEGWHRTWNRRDEAPLRWWAAAGGVGIGGSDLHDPRAGTPLAAPTTWVEVGGDGDVLAALRAGRVALSADPAGPVVVRHEDELIVDGGSGTVLVGPDGRPTAVAADRVRLPGAPGLHRLLGPDGSVVALVA